MDGFVFRDDQNPTGREITGATSRRADILNQFHNAMHCVDLNRAKTLAADPSVDSHTLRAMRSRVAEKIRATRSFAQNGAFEVRSNDDDEVIGLEKLAALFRKADYKLNGSRTTCDLLEDAVIQAPTVDTTNEFEFFLRAGITPDQRAHLLMVTERQINSAIEQLKYLHEIVRMLQEPAEHQRSLNTTTEPSKVRELYQFAA